METVTPRRFRLSDYVKDGHLARAIRAELTGLDAAQLELAQEAIMETATTGIPGGFQELLDAYRQAITRALHPERKLLKSPQIDRKIIRNPVLAEALDRELTDVTADELAKVNAALKAVLEEAREVRILRTDPNNIRWVQHEQTPTCPVYGEHPTAPSEEKQPCGYFRDPKDWTEELRRVVRRALNR